MAVGLAQVAVQDFFVNGVPAVGGLLFFYAAGTTTKITTYTDSTGATPQSNPVVLNSRGEPQGSGGQSLGLWIPANTNYKMVYSPVGDTDPPTHAIYTVDNINSSGGGGGAAGQQVYATLTAAIAATIPAGTTMVTTLGYASIGDLGGGNYLPASAGAGPGKFQSADGAWWKLSAAQPNVKQFGAKGDGSTNDATAFSNALTFWGSTGGIITVPDATYALSSGITIPDFTYLRGDVWFPNLAQIKGVQLLFANGVMTCVQLCTGSTNNSAGIENVTINRTGTPPSGSIGLLVEQGQSPVVRNVGSINHAVPMEWAATVNGTEGITCNASNIYTAGATDAHLVINSWPELQFSQVRLGLNGSADVPCNAYVRITGGPTNPGTGDGPNTINFSEFQFNSPASNAPAHAIEFVNISNPSNNVIFFKFHQGHIESVSAGTIYSDSTCSVIQGLGLFDVSVNTDVPFWLLNSATSLYAVTIVGGYYNCSTFSPPTEKFTGVAISGIYCGGAASFNASSGSTIAFNGNTWFGGLTIAGAGNFSFNGDELVGFATFTNTATGVVLVQSCSFDGAVQYTPSLRFGGVSTGITYTEVAGEYEYIALDMVRVSIFMLLSSKGSATGTATITGPVLANGTYGVGSGAVPGVAASFTGLTGAISVGGSDSGSTINLFQSGAAGGVVLTNANFTNTTTLGVELLLHLPPS